MKTKHYILLAITGLIAFLSGLFIGKGRTEKPPGTVTETRETTVDTIPYYAPMPQSELALGTHRYTLPVYRFLGGGYGGEPRQRHDSDSLSVDTLITAHYGTGAGGEPRCSKDSAIVELPIIQRHYADSTYEAWISGPVDPRLDSIRVFVCTDNHHHPARMEASQALAHRSDRRLWLWSQRLSTFCWFRNYLFNIQFLTWR